MSEQTCEDGREDQTASERERFCKFMDKEFISEQKKNEVTVSYLKNLQKDNKPVFYSTNPFVTSTISRQFRKGRYRVWCSEVFDPSREDRSSIYSLVGATSSPKKIADDLRVEMNDRHSGKIQSYKETFQRLAREWLADKSINEQQFQEIVGLVSQESSQIWQPFIYVIPRWIVHNSSRLEVVTASRRAGPGPEYIINDLEHGEFDMIGWL